MPSPGSLLTSRTVRSVHNEKLGRVVASEMSSTTHEPISILVEIDHASAAGAGAEGSAVWLSFDAVRSIRSDTLDLREPLGSLVSLDVGHP